MAVKHDLAKLPNTHSVYNPDSKEYDLIDLVSGEVVSSSALTKSLERYIFSFEYAVAICQELRKGMTFSAMGRDARFPPVEVIHLWRRMHPEFEAQVKLARMDRAEGYHDKIIDMAEALSNPSEGIAAAEVAAKKTAMEAYKWAAEKNDPEQFGKKTEVKHTDAVPTTIVINTGINRQSPPIEEVEYSEVKSE